MRIMVCFDGSNAAFAALPIAREVAECTRAEVHLVRVAPHDISAGGVPWSGSDAVDIEKHRRAVEQDGALARDLELLASGFAGPVTVTLLNGSRVAEELVRYARSNEIDLIVIGCREHGAMHPGVGGDVTARLVRSRVAPVVLGPMAPASTLDLREVPHGCAVFSRDGFYIGDLDRADAEYMRVSRRAAGPLVLPATAAGELSVASGLHLVFDMADLERHRVVAAV